MLSPDFYHRTVDDIDLAELNRRGIDTLLVDLDNTLLRRNAEEVPPEVREWARRVTAEGFSVCIVSNNWHQRVAGLAEQIGVPLVAKALKPLPHAFLKALRVTGSTRARSAVVGDQMFTDILGAKLLGIASVLVVPLSSSDLPHTLLLRRIERVLLADRRPVP